MLVKVHGGVAVDLANEDVVCLVVENGVFHRPNGFANDSTSRIDSANLSDYNRVLLVL
jgi:hypothetical protein